MPASTALIVTGIVSVFAIFAVTLAWADAYTKGRPPAAGE